MDLLCIGGNAGAFANASTTESLETLTGRENFGARPLRASVVFSMTWGSHRMTEITKTGNARVRSNPYYASHA